MRAATVVEFRRETPGPSAKYSRHEYVNPARTEARKHEDTRTDTANSSAPSTDYLASVLRPWNGLITVDRHRFLTVREPAPNFVTEPTAHIPDCHYSSLSAPSCNRLSFINVAVRSGVNREQNFPRIFCRPHIAAKKRSRAAVGDGHAKQRRIGFLWYSVYIQRP